MFILQVRSYIHYKCPIDLLSTLYAHNPIFQFLRIYSRISTSEEQFKLYVLQSFHIMAGWQKGKEEEAGTKAPFLK